MPARNARAGIRVGSSPGLGNVQLVGPDVDLERRQGQLADPGQGRHGRDETLVGRIRFERWKSAWCRVSSFRRV